MLFTYRAYYEGTERMWASERQPTVLWAGDVDADGRLDVLLETSKSLQRERDAPVSLARRQPFSAGARGSCAYDDRLLIHTRI